LQSFPIKKRFFWRNSQDGPVTQRLVRQLLKVNRVGAGGRKFFTQGGATMQRRVNLTVAAALAAALVFPAVSLAGTTHPDQAIGMKAEGRSLGHGLVVREENGISYVSGGVGDDQQNALASASNQFNMKLTMSMRDGKYVGGGDIRIEDQHGKTVLDTHATGPMFLAKLPAGHYKVHVNAEGRTFTRDVNVQNSGQQQIAVQVPASADAGATRAGDAPEH
jgi:hypothetical protein